MMYAKLLGRALTLAIILSVATGIPSAAQADPPPCKGPNADNPECTDDNQGGDGKYSVVITGNVHGSSGDNDWDATPKTVGLNVNSGLSNSFIYLHPYFTSHAFPGGPGSNCFTAGDPPLADGQMTVTGAQIKEGKHGRAEAWFWFHAKDAATGTITVFYLLRMYGIFVPGSDWPPTNTTMMTMDSWEMTIENGQPSLKGISCEGDEKNLGPWVSIGVTREN